MNCSIDGAKAATYTSAGVSVDGSGVHTVSCTAWNNAVDPQGTPNTGTASTTIHIDETPPSLAFEPLDPSDPTQLVVDTSDGLSGVAGGSIAMAPAGTQNWTSLPTTLDGHHLLASIDDAGLSGPLRVPGELLRWRGQLRDDQSDADAAGASARPRQRELCQGRVAGEGRTGTGARRLALEARAAPWPAATRPRRRALPHGAPGHPNQRNLRDPAREDRSASLARTAGLPHPAPATGHPPPGPLRPRRHRPRAFDLQPGSTAGRRAHADPDRTQQRAESVRAGHEHHYQQ